MPVTPQSAAGCRIEPPVSVAVAAGGAIVGESAASLQQANRVANGTGGGVVAVTAATAAQDVNLGASGFSLPGMGLGASGGAVTYTGTFTPGTAGVFNLGGGGGTLLFPQAITGTASVNLSAGTVALTGSSNTFTGGLTLGSTGTLQVTAGNASGGAFGNTRFGLVSQGGTIRWESGATTDITAGAGKIASTGSGGVSVNFASGTTTLDTNGNTDWTRQLGWLNQALMASNAPWKVVVGHHPIYSAGHYGDDAALIGRLTPLLARHGVQLYINGHEHNYERTHAIAGTTYLTVGGGGASLRPVTANGRTAHAASVHSFAELIVSDRTLTINGIDSQGQRLDSATLKR